VCVGYWVIGWDAWVVHVRERVCVHVRERTTNTIPINKHTYNQK